MNSNRRAGTGGSGVSGSAHTLKVFNNIAAMNGGQIGSRNALSWQKPLLNESGI
jgi:hypothetical protein